jgi:nicotinamide mononucleotide (NMN) deamidase PncC
MVCLGWAVRDSGVRIARTSRFAGDRGAVRRAAVIAALDETIVLAGAASVA